MRRRHAMHANPRAGQPEEIGEDRRLPGLRRGQFSFLLVYCK